MTTSKVFPKGSPARYLMEFTGKRDRHRGRQYECTNCGAKHWTCWGNARQHPWNCDETDLENWK